MQSPIKHLGCENLESRFNLSTVTPIVGAHALVHAAAAIVSRAPSSRLIAMHDARGMEARRPASIASVKKPTQPVVTAPVKPVKKAPATKPVITAPSAPVKAPTPVTQPATTTPVTTVASTTTPAVTTPAIITPPAPAPAIVAPAQPSPVTNPATAATQTPSASTQTSSTATTTSSVVSESTTNSTTPSVTPDPLAPILAKLYGDDKHDDSATIQQLVDTAYADGLTTISLPAGTFLLNNEIRLYGSNLTFSGQGDRTILDVNNNFNGDPNGNNGRALTVMAQLNSTPLMITQTVTGNTIVFRGNANLSAGQTLFLSNGKGSTAILEANLHGADTGPGAFNELGPDEYVQIASVMHDASGNTVATLTQNVVGTDQYGNIAPNNVASINYLHASAIDKPADHITVQNFAIKFTDMYADTALHAAYTNHLILNGIHVLNTPTAGGPGGIAVVGSMNALLENITSPSSIGLNSTRLSTITNCTVACTSLEEACTDDLITHNTLTGTTTCDFRINDMACDRNTFSFNDVHGGAWNTGAVAIAEGIGNTIANNTVHGGAASIWLGITSGTKVLDNIADAFSNNNPLSATQVSGNSW